ncbi:uncharacterized protein B0H18DRAFT_1112953 [Fomitopsis serialis]|uniref:uncharacterized protein n=1 Tax=Fomitopsis serialis TaxID=139415 RepID=UPI002007774C|nr:uncharacterized protein B0H18DRAFT_1112953 [Neoantrodia serialis]KAH9937069.1 hypothetical protein B0H18DRAFT_1112953 [Neoantrodia serialis]
MALPVVAQVATARILQKLHRQGKLSDAEWERRRREAMHFFLPANLRPHLDQEWLDKGGSSEVFLSVNLFYCTLPFMPTCDDSSSPDVPREQMSSYMHHPLFLEMVEASLQPSVSKRRLIASLWDGRASGEPPQSEILPTVFGDDTTFTVGVSSGGNYDVLQPSHYPLPPSGEEATCSAAEATSAAMHPLLRITSWETHLHVRPAYFYLVHEWFEEVEHVLVWYLGHE